MHILPNWEKLTNDKCFMNNIENGQTYSKNLAVSRFFKYVWSFFNIINGKREIY